MLVVFLKFVQRMVMLHAGKVFALVTFIVCVSNVSALHLVLFLALVVLLFVVPHSRIVLFHGLTLFIFLWLAVRANALAPAVEQVARSGASLGRCIRRCCRPLHMPSSSRASSSCSARLPTRICWIGSASAAARVPT